MASPQTRSPSFLSDCLVAFRRYPAITAFAGAGCPKEMALRPSQIRAGAAEAGLMSAAAFAGSKTYRETGMPTIILADEDDRLIDLKEQSARLHDEVEQRKLHCIAGAGHMIHQSATPGLMVAIDGAAAETLH